MARPINNRAFWPTHKAKAAQPQRPRGEHFGSMWLDRLATEVVTHPSTPTRKEPQ